MVLVRVKHDDPTARISFATESEPDEKGGFLVEQQRVAELAFNGWRVVHIDNDDADGADKAARLKTKEDAAATVRQRSAEEQIAVEGGVPDPDFSKTEDSVNEGASDQDGAQPKPKNFQSPLRRK